jgi:hypothetical protein
MLFAFHLLLAYALPMLVAISCAAVWWRTLPSPWLFLVFSWLVLLGLQRIISGAWSLAKLELGSGGFYLQRQSDMPEQTLLMESAAVAVLFVVLGVPLLMALKNGLAKL